MLIYYLESIKLIYLERLKKTNLSTMVLKKLFYKFYKFSILYNFKDFLAKSSHRLLLEKILKKTINNLEIKTNHKLKTIVDYGAGIPRYKGLLRNSDWKFFDKYPQDPIVKYADVDNIPLEEADLLICIEVICCLSYEETEILLKEITRIIDKKGVAVLTYPFLVPTTLNEKIRFANPDILKKFMPDKFKFHSKSFGNLFSIIHDTIFQYHNFIKFRFIRLIFCFLLLPLKILSIIFESIDFVKLPSGYIIEISCID